MSRFWWVPFTAGFGDSFNPLVLMACAVMLLLVLWLQRRQAPVGKHLGLFICIILLINLGFNLNFLTLLLSAAGFELVSLWLCKILAVVFLALGGVFFYDWIKIRQASDPQKLWSGRLFASKGAAAVSKAFVVTLITGILTGAATTLWPMNYYMAMVSNNLIVPGRFLDTGFLVIVYTGIEFWALFFLAYICACKTLNPRLQQMVNAAFFLCAGGAMLYVL